MKLQNLIFLLLLHVFNQVETQSQGSCNNGDINLMGNLSRFEGRLAVCRGTRWGAVIDTFWTANDEIVVCRQLGFEITGELIFEEYQVKRQGLVLVETVQCSGHEDRLFACIYNNINKWNYDGNVVGVRCKEDRPPQNVSIQEDGDSVATVSWSPPLTGTTEEAVHSYEVECTTFTQLHSVHLSVDNDTHTAKLDHLLPTSSYNCCVEVFFESYSSRACVSLNTGAVEALGSNRGANTVGGVLGFIIVVLVILLVLAGIILMYPRVIEPRIKDNAFFSRLSWLTFWTATNSNQNQENHTHVHTPSAISPIARGPPVTAMNHNSQPTDYVDSEYSIVGPPHPQRCQRISIPDRYEFSGSCQQPSDGAGEYEVPMSLNEDEGGSPYSHLQH